MRTTVTLDPDVEKLLRDTVRERGVSFKHALNEAIRTGMGGQKRARRFVQKTHNLGSGQTIRWDKALSEAAALEDEELLRKFSLRK